MPDKHTPEPWVVITGRRTMPYLAGTTRCDDFHWNGSHHDIGELYWEPDMKRAAACVNALRGIDDPEAWVEQAKRCIAFVESAAKGYTPDRLAKAASEVEACRGCTNSGSVADAEAEYAAAWKAQEAWNVLNTTPARSETAKQPQDSTAGGDQT